MIAVGLDSLLNVVKLAQWQRAFLTCVFWGCSRIAQYPGAFYIFICLNMPLWGFAEFFLLPEHRQNCILGYGAQKSVLKNKCFFYSNTVKKKLKRLFGWALVLSNGGIFCHLLKFSHHYSGFFRAMRPLHFTVLVAVWVGWTLQSPQLQKKSFY